DGAPTGRAAPHRSAPAPLRDDRVRRAADLGLRVRARDARAVRALVGGGPALAFDALGQPLRGGRLVADVRTAVLRALAGRVAALLAATIRERRALRAVARLLLRGG